MTVEEIARSLDLTVLSGGPRLSQPVAGGYASDLLSDVMANSREGDIWITLQTHQNIIAVAKLKNLSAVVLVNSRTPDPETLQKAEQEGIVLCRTADPAFVFSGRLYELLGRGKG
ncbi:MAG: serine kinase [Candidatus Aminicenantes bacterium]|nr:serine kinase [Candidatus Aminicenantes bacterium]